ncbi:MULTISPECIES: CxxH/CxxC protein [Bacillaceae]|uniref:CxxH/CxxC protein n=1 Tax=Bacillaceae TaxID=186817 RepID=UPI00104B1D02|nr:MULTISPECIES: CxxH/CxxC protein [Bacillaceae]MDT2044769.1 CxxH/CxxC protein [Priestia flexa]TDB52024.1 CxxH/CxxC protein [Bacillus sp. CBEL-1]USY55143.1 CxxH/CxxC protein [Bacillus sp. 1780r2a1]
MKIYCCLEHTELALDVAVDEIELAPVFKEITEDERNHVCEYCENPALYTVEN